MRLPGQQRPVIRADRSREKTREINAAVLKLIKNAQLTNKGGRALKRAVALRDCKARCVSHIAKFREICMQMCMKQHGL